MSDTLERSALNKVDITRGECRSEVSSQWMMRPADQKFTSLGALRKKVKGWADASAEHDLIPRGFHAVNEGTDLLVYPGKDLAPVRPTNWGFANICQTARAPASYLSRLPAKLAADCLNAGFKKASADKPVQLYIGSGKPFDDEPKLRALTSVSYGRITDVDVVDAVMKFAGQGNGDTRWKVPGVMSWADMRYNPNVDITTETTTLFASDRDIFLFLVDDKNPIEIGKLPNGDPDVVFRGFYVWNSETGSRTFGVATMYLRGVCCNRLLWGVEGFNETTFRHTAGAPERFNAEAAPALNSYAETAASKLIEGVTAARQAVVAKTPEERLEFLQKFGFSKAKALDLITTHIVEEGREPDSIWDFAQAVTAVARQCQFQDERVKLEQAAGKLLAKVKV